MGITTALLSSRTLAALTSPHGVDRYLEVVNPMWAATDVRARVVSVHHETAGKHPVATLTLQPTNTWRGHRAGQYVQVGVEMKGTIAGRRLTRCFSISSASSAPGEQFTLTVRAHDEGCVSRFLVRDARPGQMLHLSQAEGEFTLPESAATPTNSPRLMISGGSGITPVMSHLRTLVRDGDQGHVGHRVTFLHYARTPEDQIFADELREIAAADNGVDVHLVHTEAGGERFSAAALDRLVPGFRDVSSWACGPAGLIGLVTDAYGGSDRLQVEYFKPPLVASGAAEGEVSFSGSGRSAVNSGAPLLDQAEALGLTPAFGCRMGVCFSCTSRKSEGTIRNVITGIESARPDEDIQICVSAPVGDCVVDL